MQYIRCATHKHGITKTGYSAISGKMRTENRIGMRTNEKNTIYIFPTYDETRRPLTPIMPGMIQRGRKPLQPGNMDQLSAIGHENSGEPINIEKSCIWCIQAITPIFRVWKVHKIIFVRFPWPETGPQLNIFPSPQGKGEKV